jgi:hypothetical protein
MHTLRTAGRFICFSPTFIALRAHYRIGQISKALQTKRRRDHKGRLLRTGAQQAKGDHLSAAGISWRSAQRDEKLTEIISEAIAFNLRTDAHIFSPAFFDSLREIPRSFNVIHASPGDACFCLMAPGNPPGLSMS